MHSRKLRGDLGASAVEYGLIVFAIAAIISVVVFAFGRVVTQTFDNSCSKIRTQVEKTESTC